MILFFFFEEKKEGNKLQQSFEPSLIYLARAVWKQQTKYCCNKNTEELRGQQSQHQPTFLSPQIYQTTPHLLLTWKVSPDLTRFTYVVSMSFVNVSLLDRNSLLLSPSRLRQSLNLHDTKEEDDASLLIWPQASWRCSLPSGKLLTHLLTCGWPRPARHLIDSISPSFLLRTI